MARGILLLLLLAPRVGSLGHFLHDSIISSIISPLLIGSHVRLHVA